MPISMYMGKPLTGQKPNIAIDLFDNSLGNLAPAYLTNKLNEKIMNGLTDKSGTITVDGDTITANYDDGTMEIMTINGDVYTIKTYSSKGILLKYSTITYDEITGKIRTDVSYDGSVNGVVDFATASWEEIGSMLQRHYAGLINLADFWSVGEEKVISYGPMTATGVSESHKAASQKIKIIGFNHDTITGGAKAAITLQMSNGLGIAGYMHPTNTNNGGWGACNRRTWCNNTFFNALDPGLRKLIKPVDKYCTAGRRSNDITTVSDKCFLLSESELMGTGTSLSCTGEGEQYAYFIGGDSLKKRQNDIVSGYDNWYTRSAAKDSTSQYVFVESDGEINTGDANGQYQIVPALCI